MPHLIGSQMIGLRRQRLPYVTGGLKGLALAHDIFAKRAPVLRVPSGWGKPGFSCDADHVNR
jgi:hypothetical protein